MPRGDPLAIQLKLRHYPISAARLAMLPVIEYSATVRRIIGTKLFGILLLGAAVLCFEGKAWAYGDPGSGTLLWQMLLAASVGFMFNVRRIIAWFRSARSRSVTGKTNTNQDRTE
jgi:hypothetical protein